MEKFELLLWSQHEDLLQQLREIEMGYYRGEVTGEGGGLTLPGVGMLIKLWM